MSSWSSRISRVTMYLMTNNTGNFIKDVLFKPFSLMFVRMNLPLMVLMVNMDILSIILDANRLHSSLSTIPQSAVTCTKTYHISGHMIILQVQTKGTVQLPTSFCLHILFSNEGYADIRQYKCVHLSWLYDSIRTYDICIHIMHTSIPLHLHTGAQKTSQRAEDLRTSYWCGSGMGVGFGFGFLDFQSKWCDFLDFHKAIQVGENGPLIRRFLRPPKWNSGLISSKYQISTPEEYIWPQWIGTCLSPTRSMVPTTRTCI